MTDAWTPVGAVDPRSLAAERLQLHYGAWLLASVAHSLLPEVDDDSHTNLGWADGRFTTRPLAGSATSLALDVRGLALRFDADGEVRAALELPGRTMADALAWAGEFARSAFPGSPDVARRAFPDFPASPLGEGGAFAAGDAAARAEIAAWFANADALLGAATANEPGASAARTWPHHFDIGALLDLGAGRSVGLGLSPGDEIHDQPYFYVYAYPTPDPSRFAPLTGSGAWTTAGFTGALLLGTEVIAAAEPAAACAAFLREAVAACKATL